MKGHRADDEHGISPIEHELTMHLERAHELGERAKKANGAVRDEIARARDIAERLKDRVLGWRSGD